ncbi:MAG TPA: Re/Si-specific NAD(P)(+) transhydrogenase subunit alpha [Kiloniellales bacterium]|jgi:NAD(P) transhydrogenase subunit alpha
MKIAIPRERRAHETRVAASPETVKKLVALGCEVVIEKGAGSDAAFPDEAYKQAGATVAKDAKTALSGADVVLKVQRPIAGGAGDEIGLLKKDAIVIAILDPMRAGDDMAALAKAGLTAFAMDMMPRITRAQSMDVLSSQANLAGYKAVLDAAAEYGRAMPMMMTAAGTIAPARVLVMGAGVAGLQAIATARRLGAIVSATDVRPAAKEQVESLGGTFVAVEDEEFKQAETAGGYAKEMSAAYKAKQADLIAETIKKQDMVITTALIPGRPAPVLVSADMVKSMKPGSVIVDLAVEAGGNCALSQPGKVAVKHGVRIVGHMNVPGRLAADASALYARNLFNLLQLMIDKDSKALAIDWDDEIIKGICVTRGGAVVHPALAGKGS